MGEVYYISKYKSALNQKNDANLSDDKKECELISFNLPYAHRLVSNAIVKIGKRDDIGGLTDVNRATEIFLNNKVSRISISAMGVMHFNVGNYDLASMHLFKAIANERCDCDESILEILTCLLDVEGSTYASNTLKHKVFEKENFSIVQVSKVHNALKNWVLTENPITLNLDFLKKKFKNLMMEENFKQAKKVAKLLWELDRSDPYIAFSYFNADKVSSYSEFEQLYYLDMDRRFMEIGFAIKDREKMIQLLEADDADSLLTLVMTYCKEKTKAVFLAKAILLRNTRFTYWVENYLFVKNNDRNKLLLFLTCIMFCQVNFDSYFALRYKDFVVKVNYFSYQRLDNLNHDVAIAVLRAVETLINSGWREIDIGGCLLKFLQEEFRKMSDEEKSDTEYLCQSFLKVFYNENPIERKF